MKARTIAIAALLAVMLGAAGWWFGSPWWTLRQVQRAADARDAAALSAYVDYPALRTDVKQQAQRTISQAAATDDPLIALGAAVAGVLVDPAVEALVTPDGVAAMFAQAPVAETPVEKAPPARGAPFGLPKLDLGHAPKIERIGLDQFRVADRAGRGTARFVRHGLGWRLAGIRLAVSG